MKYIIATILLGAVTLAPTPPADPPVPLELTPGNVFAVDVVAEGDGRQRLAGNLIALVDETFNTGLLRPTGVQLLRDDGPVAGARLLILRAAEPRLDEVEAQIAAVPGVLSVDRDYLHEGQTADPYWYGQVSYGLGPMDLERAWAIGQGHHSVRVAVIDSGVSAVGDLVGTVVPGRNFVASPPNTTTTDYNGHGTQVATIIAGRADNNIGGAGIASGVTIVPVKACDTTWLGLSQCPETALLPALQYVAGLAVAGDVDIVHMSLGGSPSGPNGGDYYLDVIRNADAVLVASAGNSGDPDVDWPSNHDAVIAVGGTSANGTRHPSSDYGDRLDLAAPYQTYSINHAGDVGLVSGTSYSAPVISGLVALWKSASLVEMDLLDDGSRLWRDHGSGWNPETGYGLPNAYTVLWHRACSVYDVSGDREVDVVDMQMASYRYGSWYASPLYDVRYDLEPWYDANDGDIDIVDLQKFYGRVDMRCRGY